LWGGANFWYEFLRDTEADFSSAAGFVPVHADLGGASVEFNGGVTAQITRRLSVRTNATYRSDFAGRQNSYGGQLGINVQW
jgi:outer membrane autotransporter protein